MGAYDKIDAQARTEKPIPQAELHPYQRAVVETALAYYYRGKAIQYDSVELTQQDRWQGGIIRETNYCSPETPNENRPMFSVCSAFCYEVYYYTFGGWELLGSQLNCWTVPMSALPARDPLVVFRRNYKRPIKKAEPLGEREADLRELERIIEPGDVLVASNPAGGHAMLYVGDAFGDGGKWLIHCWGDKYDKKTGKDAWETNRDHNWEGGAIIRDPLHTFLFDPKAICTAGRRKTITVLRPLKKLIRTKYPLNPAAAYRLKFPRLTVNRRADHDHLRDVEPGGEITVKIGVTNNLGQDYTEPITVTEKIPALCSLKPGSLTCGGKRRGKNGLVWTVGPLRRGEEITLSYTLQVDGDPANVGKTIRLNGGKVGELPTNEIPVRIGGKHLKPEQIALLAELQGGVKLAEKKLEGAAFAEAFYEKLLRLAPKLPTMEALEKTLFRPKAYVGSPVKLLTPVKGFYEKAPMLVPTFFGGHDVWTKSSYERALTMHTRQMIPGDVFLTQEGLFPQNTPDCFIYLGNDRFAVCGSCGDVRIKSYAETAEKLLAMRLFFSLRPSLAYRDIFAEASAKHRKRGRK